ncbi:MAG: hypothetical protein PHI97_29825 [Desulfobulbus sp.]|nr:hypothetical protein [Desulfobulbus sp.]
MACPLELKDTMSLLTFVPILISFVILVIAWVQLSINRSQLRLNLYNRRFAVYDKTLSYCLIYMKPEKRTDVEIRERETEFVRAYRESIFLFGENSNVHKALTEIKYTLGQLIGLKEDLNSKRPDTDEHKEIFRLIQLQPDLAKLLQKLELSLWPWLDFHKIGAISNTTEGS